VTAKVSVVGTRPMLFHKFGPEALPLEKQEKVGVAGNDPSEWRKIYERWKAKASISGIHRDLIDLYKSKLSALGYADIHDQEAGCEPIMRNTKQAPLYRLIFASKHKRGHDFWNKVTERDLYGNKRLF